MAEIDLLTDSAMKAARACFRLYHVEFGLGYRPVTDEDVLRFGSLIHRGLEAWWLAKKEGKNELNAALAAIEGESDPFDKVRAEVLLTAYYYRWADEPYEVLAVEAKFECPLINPQTGAPSRTWRLAGKIDVIVRDLRDGRILIIEHKTSSEDISPGSTYWARLRMDGQVSTYFLGAGALGHDVAGCLYDVLGKPAQRPSQVPLLDENKEKIVIDATGKRVKNQQGRWRQTGDTAQGYVLQTRDETPEEFRDRLLKAITDDPNRYLARGEVMRLESEMQEAMFDIWQQGVMLREARAANRWPRNPDACTRYNRQCPFFDVCTGAASLEDRTRFTRLTDVHPELEGAQQ